MFQNVYQKDYKVNNNIKNVQNTPINPKKTRIGSASLNSKNFVNMNKPQSNSNMVTDKKSISSFKRSITPIISSQSRTLDAQSNTESTILNSILSESEN